MQRGDHPTLGRVATEADRQVHQFGRGRGRPAHPRRVRRGVERPKRDMVAAGRRQCEMSGPQLWLVDEFGEPAVHRPSPARGGLGVDAPRQQGMREVDPVAVDRDDALALGDFEKLDQPVVVADRRARHQLDGRCTHAGRCEQCFVHVGVETADPVADDVGQRARKRRLAARCTFVDGPGQFDRVERVSAGHRVDPTHRRAGERSPQPTGDRRVQIVNTQRTQSDSVDRLGPWQL